MSADAGCAALSLSGNRISTSPVWDGRGVTSHTRSKIANGRKGKRGCVLSAWRPIATVVRMDIEKVFKTSLHLDTPESELLVMARAGGTTRGGAQAGVRARLGVRAGLREDCVRA